MVVWQAKTGSGFQAVGSVLEQDWRQETEKLLTQALLHRMESLGWDEWGRALLCSFSLLCLPLAQLSHNEVQRDCVELNNIHLLQDESRSLCSVTEDDSCCSRTLFLLFQIFPHLLVMNLAFSCFSSP